MSIQKSIMIPILLACWWIGLGGCGASIGPDDLPRAAVAGTVSLGGKPLDGIDIIFESDPVGEHGRRRAVHTTIRGGEYSISEQEGPAIGTATVRFLDVPESREQLESELNEANRAVRRARVVSYPIPEKYASGSTLKVQISNQRTNTHHFNLQ